jgi:hypothetical protein
MLASARNMVMVWAMVASLLVVPLLAVASIADSLVIPDIDTEVKLLDPGQSTVASYNEGGTSSGDRPIRRHTSDQASE